jgi:hypothetical protein
VNTKPNAATLGPIEETPQPPPLAPTIEEELHQEIWKLAELIDDLTVKLEDGLLELADVKHNMGDLGLRIHDLEMEGD